MSANFTINDLEFAGNRISLVRQEPLDQVFTVKANWHLKPSLNWSSLMLDMNATEDFHELHMSEFHFKQDYWAMAGFIGSTSVILILIIVIVCLCCCKKKNKPITVSVHAKPLVSNDVEMKNFV